MIKQSVLRDKFIKTYSTRNRKVKQIDTGLVFDTAVDLKELVKDYEETEEFTERYKQLQRAKNEGLNDE